MMWNKGVVVGGMTETSGSPLVTYWGYEYPVMINYLNKHKHDNNRS
jgi:hypothetical protein